ncbi:unnamed protein product, partial [Brenthis ino]
MTDMTHHTNECPQRDLNPRPLAQQRGARAACTRRGHHPARPLDTTLYHYTVGHEKSRLFAGCPYQRVRGDFHLSSSRGHTALVDDRGALRP